MSGRVHVVGGGLAGLSAAVRLVQKGVRVVLSEAAGQAGGRCRSYYDPTFDRIIDNGNHLVLSGNRAVQSYLRLIGAAAALQGPETAAFAFVDLEGGERWTLRPNAGRLPWWIFSSRRRVPGTTARDYLRYAGLLRKGAGPTIGAAVPCEGVLWRRLVHPFLKAVLNTEPAEASAALAAAVLRETLAKGGKAYRPRIAQPTLAMAFVEPALALLAAKGAEVRLNRRLRGISVEGGRAVALDFSGAVESLGAGDEVVLATPPWVTADLLPAIPAPDEFRAVVNGHFLVPPPKGTPSIMGVIGGTAEWIFSYSSRIAVTVSAADAAAGEDREALAKRLWSDVSRALGMPAALPPWQIVKEKRATFAAVPAEAAKRPGTRTFIDNLVLAGDWIDTGLPATIESALRSGEMAAAALLNR